MLKKGKRPEDEKSAAYSDNTDQKPFTSIPRPETTMEKTVIGEKISIEGNTSGDEHIVIEGSM